MDSSTVPSSSAWRISAGGPSAAASESMSSMDQKVQGQNGPELLCTRLTTCARTHSSPAARSSSSCRPAHICTTREAATCEWYGNSSSQHSLMYASQSWPHSLLVGGALAWTAPSPLTVKEENIGTGSAHAWSKVRSRSSRALEARGRSSCGVQSDTAFRRAFWQADCAGVGGARGDQQVVVRQVELRGIRIGEAQLDDARGGRHRSRRAHEQLVACVRQRCGERREVSRRRG